MKFRILVPIPELDNTYKKNMINGIRQNLLNNCVCFSQGVEFYGGIDFDNKERQMIYKINIYKFIHGVNELDLLKDLIKNTSLKYACYMSNMKKTIFISDSVQDINNLNNDQLIINL